MIVAVQQALPVAQLLLDIRGVSLTGKGKSSGSAVLFLTLRDEGAENLGLTRAGIRKMRSR